MLTEVAREWRAAGYRSGVAATSAMLARAAAGARGRSTGRSLLFDEAVLEFRAIGSQAEALEAEARRAECLLLAGEPARAIETVDAALGPGARASAGCRPSSPSSTGSAARRWPGCGDHRRGAGRPASGASSAAEARRGGARTGTDQTGAGPGGGVGGARRRGGLLDRADAVLDGLGIVWTPDLL